jgi:hypothetical protein
MSFDFEKVFEDEFISIKIDNKLKFIQVSWLQHPDSDTFRRCFALAAEIVLARRCRYWLSDSRAVHYLEFAEQNWILDTMAPLLGNSCLTKFARINSQESLALLDIDRILYGLELSPHIRYAQELAIFMDKQEALDWLFRETEILQQSILQKRHGLQVPSGPMNLQQ